LYDRPAPTRRPIPRGRDANQTKVERLNFAAGKL
jgi:hypothetical protein